MSTQRRPILSVRDLRVNLSHRGRAGLPVAGFDLDVSHGEVVGLIGETGAGKSLTARAITMLLPRGARIVGGEIVFEGRNLLGLDAEEMRLIRGSRIGMIFQNPRESLVPVHTIERQLKLVLKRTAGSNERTSRSYDDGVAEYRRLLGALGLRDPERVLKSYPHQLSGGMAQRVFIALVLAGDPDLLIADEPATGLDAATQAQLLLEFGDLIREREKTAIVITHDLSSIIDVCDSLAVMYAGRVVERGTVERVLGSPQHPYTAGLLASANLSEGAASTKYIPGTPPSPFAPIAGCPFHPRCPEAFEQCREIDPETTNIDGRYVRCHLYA